MAAEVPWVPEERRGRMATGVHKEMRVAGGRKVHRESMELRVPWVQMAAEVLKVPGGKMGHKVRMVA